MNQASNNLLLTGLPEVLPQFGMLIERPPKYSAKPMPSSGYSSDTSEPPFSPLIVIPEQEQRRFGQHVHTIADLGDGLVQPGQLRL